MHWSATAPGSDWDGPQPHHSARWSGLGTWGIPHSVSLEGSDQVVASRVDRSSSSTGCDYLLFIHILLSHPVVTSCTCILYMYPVVTSMYIIAQLIMPWCERLKMRSGLLLSVQTYIVACNRQHAIQTVMLLKHHDECQLSLDNYVKPDQVNPNWSLARGIEVLFMATSDCFPSHPTNKDVTTLHPAIERTVTLTTAS